jgi:hypothetical protein
MNVVTKHRCADHVIDLQTETLIIGTFNPDTKGNSADFFYGRSRNHLWTILEKAFGGTREPLKKATRDEKLKFIRANRIDFIDLISEVEGEPPDYKDETLDKLVTKWRNVVEEIDKLHFLKRACITRKGFIGVPRIESRVNEIAEYFRDKQVVFRCVHTPARAHSRAAPEWIDFLRSEPLPG